MKIKTVLLKSVLFLLAGALFFSCEKDLSLDNPEPDMSALKGKPVKLSDLEQLGKEIYFDEISDPDNPEGMSCATCHPARSGFSSPLPKINEEAGIMPGIVPERFGNRKVPSAAYATFSPNLDYVQDGEDWLFIGGNFWDGRATGEETGTPAGDQAIGPFLNPVEHNNASQEDVLQTIAESDYYDLWVEQYGPIDLTGSSGDIYEQYKNVGRAIAAFEASADVNQFSSKYDAFLAGKADLTEAEAWGLDLFEGKGKCNLCHPSEGERALFTDFSFDNLGTPKNPNNPFYLMGQVLLDNGDPINPEGAAWIDPGLGGFLETVPKWAHLAGENMGKHKVPTLRNVAKGPGNDFPKAYMHNGVFKSLKEVVNFYNTRDVDGAGWPDPEVADNVNDEELGDLGLTPDEEDAIVAFMETLSDGYIK